MAFARSYAVSIFAATVLASAIATASGCSFLVSLDGLADGGGDGATLVDGAPVSDGGVTTNDSGTGSDSGGTSCGRTFSNAAASSFSDDFSAGTPDPNWNLVSAGCVAQSGNEITATPAASTVGAYCFYATNANYHVTCDSVIVKVPATLQSTVGAQTFIYLNNGTSSASVNLILEGGGFFLGLADGSVSIPVNDPYDPVQDLWWKLSEQSGQLTFETSPDGTTWTVRGSGPDPMSLDNINISIGAGTWKAIATPGDAKFRCYNKPPPCE